MKELEIVLKNCPYTEQNIIIVKAIKHILSGGRINVSTYNEKDDKNFFIDNMESLSDDIKELVTVIINLLKISLKTFKLEALTYRFASMQIIMKNPYLVKAQEALAKYTVRDKFSDKKLSLIAKYFSKITMYLTYTSLEKINKNLNNVFKELPKLDYVVNNESQLEESFIYKTIIELSLIQKELVENLITGVNSELECYNNLNNEKAYVDTYKSLGSIQSYLNTLNLKHLLNIKNNQDGKNKLNLIINEINGAIVTLEGKFKEMKLDLPNSAKSKYSEMAMMYMTSLIDNAYSKKIVLETLRYIVKK